MGADRTPLKKGETEVSLSVGQIARFRLDDTDDPGWARVRILEQVPGILGLPTYRVEVVDVIKPGCSRSPRRGSKLTVAAVDLAGDIRLYPDKEGPTSTHDD